MIEYNCTKSWFFSSSTTTTTTVDTTTGGDGGGSSFTTTTTTLSATTKSQPNNIVPPTTHPVNSDDKDIIVVDDNNNDQQEHNIHDHDHDHEYYNKQILDRIRYDDEQRLNFWLEQREQVQANHHVGTKQKPSKSTFLIGMQSHKHLRKKKPTKIKIIPTSNYLLDFAIVGFAKCGTTTMGKLLSNLINLNDGQKQQQQQQPSQIQRLTTGTNIEYPYTFNVAAEEKETKENVALQSIVKSLYDEQLPPSNVNDMIIEYNNTATISSNSTTSMSTAFTSLKIGHRFPGDIRRYGFMQTILPKYFPTTKLIISVRHPVLWFESFYNYRILEGYSLERLGNGNPNNLIRSIKGNFYDVSTNRGEFHKWLAIQLNKTPMNTSEELQLITPFLDERIPQEKKIRDELQSRTLLDDDNTAQKQEQENEEVYTNPVFFLEMSQLSDNDDEMRSSTFRYDLARFLGLPNPSSAIPPIQKVIPNHNKNNDYQDNEDDQNQAVHLEERKQHTINICDTKYQPVREELMNISRNASIWFRNYFMIHGPKKWCLHIKLSIPKRDI